jgi:hypothetical protein
MKNQRYDAVAGMKKSRRRRKWNEQVRRRLSWTGYRVRPGLLVLIGLCLLLALRCLDLIGPPPRFRIDTLWVNQHIYLVRVMLAALTVSALATGMLIFNRRGWAYAILLWVLTCFAAVWFYDDRLWIIFRVIIRHA